MIQRLFVADQIWGLVIDDHPPGVLDLAASDTVAWISTDSGQAIFYVTY